MAGERTFVVKLFSDFSPKGFTQAIAKFKSLEGAGAKANFVLQKAALPAAAALTAVAGAATFAVKAAIEDIAAQEQLAGVIKRSTAATDGAVKMNEKFISTLSRATATADDDLRPALATLVGATGNLEVSQQLLLAAQDLAVSKGVDLATATDVLSKAYNGNMKSLRALSPDLGAAIKDGASFESVMATLAETTGGAASAAANTTAGKMKGLSIAFSETKESIGMALLPAIEALLPVMQTVGEFAQDHTKLFVILGATVSVLALAVLGYNAYLKVSAAVTGIMTAVTWAWNAALLANPIVLIGVAIVAFIAIMTALYFKFDAVRQIVDTVFDGIQVGVKVSMSVLSTYFKGLYQGFRTIFNQIAGLWNDSIGSLSFRAPDWVPKFGGKGWDVPDIPLLAQGGIATRATLGIFGEAGPEAIIPLPKLGEMLGGGRGGSNINVTINSLVADASLPQLLVDALQTYNKRVGPLRVQVA